MPDNELSQIVAINNGGELVYSGVVPRDEMIRAIDGVKNVNVYCIKM